MKTLLHICTMTLSCNHPRLKGMSYYDYISMFTDNVALNDFSDTMVRISSVSILMCYLMN